MSEVHPLQVDGRTKDDPATDVAEARFRAEGEIGQHPQGRAGRPATDGLVDRVAPLWQRRVQDPASPGRIRRRPLGPSRVNPHRHVQPFALGIGVEIEFRGERFETSDVRTPRSPVRRWLRVRRVDRDRVVSVDLGTPLGRHKTQLELFLDGFRVLAVDHPPVHRLVKDRADGAEILALLVHLSDQVGHEPQVGVFVTDEVEREHVSGLAVTASTAAISAASMRAHSAGERHRTTFVDQTTGRKR